MHRWIVSPYYFELDEPAVVAIAPGDAVMNVGHTLADRTAAGLAPVYQPIAAFVTEAAQAGATPVSAAGDCSATLPVVAGLQAAGIAPVLVWIDAHGDFNTPETSPSQFLGGMPLAMLVGRGPRDYCQSVGLTVLEEHDVWLIDGRDLDPLEREALDASAIRRTGMAGLASLRIDGRVYLHFDNDVLNPADAPAMNYPAPGGPTTAETVAACRAFVAANDVVAISLSGWNSALDTDGRSQAATALVMAALTGV